MKIFSNLFSSILLVFFFKIPKVKSTKYEEILLAIKEVAYSYYMRGKNIQYNSYKQNYFPPEEATPQNINYLVCSAFTYSLYKELLNITIPYLSTTFNYSKKNLGNPEVIAYAHINDNNNVEMMFYSPKNKTNYTTIINPSINDIIPKVQIGDVLTFTGHTFLIYDTIKDTKGNIIDAIIMESGYGSGGAYVNSKISKTVILENGSEFSHQNHYLYLNSKLNTNLEEGLEQGSLSISKLSANKNWNAINNTQTRKDEYSILRIIQKDSNGNAILRDKSLYPKKSNDVLNNGLISLSEKNLARLKFSHLYIEKTVNKINDNIVNIGDILSYKILLRNKGKKNYSNDLIIIENLSKFVSYESYYTNKMAVSFKYEISNKRLIWNIGKLNKDEEVNIYYYVKIISGRPGDIIESTGIVGNISSSTVRNIIGIDLNTKQKKLIKDKFEKLKNKYNGKKLINQIYKEVFNVNIKFDQFDITKLIINNNLSDINYKSIYLNKNNSFYMAILNKYWSTLTSVQHSYIKGGQKVNIYDLKKFRPYTDLERRQDYLYLKTFKTGDILIYKNNNDAIYYIDQNNKLFKNYITYEEGEYAYIYLEGKGFVGVNLGDDGIPNTKDDRNEFTAKYYLNNKLNIYNNSKNPNNETLEIGNINSLFGKDYYVILRPSLCFNFQNNDKSSTLLLLISLLIVIIIIIIGFILFEKYKKYFRKDKPLTERLIRENNKI